MAWTDRWRLRDKRGGILVSTVRLPMVVPGGQFETMVFGGPRDQEMRRYETQEAAEAGHKQMVEEVLGGSD